jgi:tetratricopeptide (TPR) repeat protein
MIQLDPLSGGAYGRLGYALTFARQYDESVAAFRKYLAMNPDATAVHAALAQALFLAGEYEAALAEFEAESLRGFTYYGRAMTYHEMGEQEKSDAALKALLALDDAESYAAQLATVYAVRGENDEAFKWLNRGLELNDQGILGTQMNPFYDNIRDDPRFAEFVQRIWTIQD